MNITEEMVERGAQFLWHQEGDEHSLAEFEAVTGNEKVGRSYRQQARGMLQAALWGPADESVEDRAKRLFDESEPYGNWDNAWEPVQKHFLRVSKYQLAEQNKEEGTK